MTTSQLKKQYVCRIIQIIIQTDDVSTGINKLLKKKVVIVFSNFKNTPNIENSLAKTRTSFSEPHYCYLRSCVWVMALTERKLL
jgi:hypothetical protein